MSDVQELKNIVYVEDEPDIQMVARMALESIGGFDLVVCNNGLEALEKVNNNKPDLVLMDVMMPEMDGLSAYQKFLENEDTADIPVIFMTAKVQKAEIDYYKSLGAIGVIPKPFDPMTISDQIKEIWIQHHGR